MWDLRRSKRPPPLSPAHPARPSHGSMLSPISAKSHTLTSDTTPRVARCTGALAAILGVSRGLDHPMAMGWSGDTNVDVGPRVRVFNLELTVELPDAALEVGQASG